MSVGLGKVVFLKQDVDSLLNPKTRARFAKKFEVLGACGDIFTVEESWGVGRDVVGKAASK